ARCLTQRRRMPSGSQDGNEADLPSLAGDGHDDAHTKAGTAALTLGALGVVYGDIGTSPIYAFREAVRAATGDGPNTDTDILGILSLIVWSLTLIVAVKYMLLVLRADNRGEGGVLSLMALARHDAGRFSGLVVFLGMAG